MLSPSELREKGFWLRNFRGDGDVFQRELVSTVAVLCEQVAELRERCGETLSLEDRVREILVHKWGIDPVPIVASEKPQPRILKASETEPERYYAFREPGRPWNEYGSGGLVCPGRDRKSFVALWGMYEFYGPIELPE